MTASGDELTAAANLLRSAGYAVVTQTQADFWDRWLKESHKREGEAQDEVSHLVGELGWVLDKVSAELAPSRPRWLRDARAWFNRSAWTEPVVFRQSGAS